jgi:hypothetical protein
MLVLLIIRRATHAIYKYGALGNPLRPYWHGSEADIFPIAMIHMGTPPLKKQHRSLGLPPHDKVIAYPKATNPVDDSITNLHFPLSGCIRNQKTVLNTSTLHLDNSIFHESI